MILFIIPIIIYFVVEWLFGPIVAMAGAVAFSLIELIVKYIRQRKFDKSPIIDMSLVIVFGLCEYFTEGEKGIIYIVMPALLTLMIAITLFTPLDIFAALGGSYLQKLLRSPFNRRNLRRSEARMLVWCIAMVVLECVPLFDNIILSKYPDYQLFAVVVAIIGYIATEYIAGRLNRRRYRKSEWVPLMNEKAEVIGTAPRELVHNGSLWLHPVVHLHVVHNGKLLLQLRPKSKKIQPGKWDTAVGGHIAANEQLETALKREVWEEIGLREFRAKLQARYIWRSNVEHEYIFSFITDSAGPFRTMNAGEVDDLRFWSKQELTDSLGRGIFTPNLEHELQTYILSQL